jgi:VWFA-related protein
LRIRNSRALCSPLGPTTKRWRVALVLAGISSFTALPDAQRDQSVPPTFQTSINYVVLPVRVLNADGQFVRGLSPGDFVVREDGKHQTIASFNLVDIPFIAAEALTANEGELEPVASNQGAEINGRVYGFVVDDLFLQANDTLKLRNLLRRFILEKMSANDVGAMVLTSRLRYQNFTQNRRLLIDAVDAVVGSFDPKLDAPAVQVYDRRRRAAIAHAARWLGAVQDRQKAMVIMSPSFGCVLRTDARRQTVDDGKPTTCGEIFEAAVRSGVSIYTFDSRGPVAPTCATAEFSGETCFGPTVGSARSAWAGALSGARTLAEETGGFAVFSTNSFDMYFDRMVQENSAYYLIGYYSTKNRTDGSFREHEIKVNRPGVRVVHRYGYQAPRNSDVRRDTARASAPTGVSERLQALADNPLPVADMRMHVAAATLRAANGRSTVAIVVEMPGDTLQLETSGDHSRLNVGLSIGLFDRFGKPVGEDNPRIDLDVPIAEGRDVSTHGMRVLSNISVPPGTYRVWAGATQTPSRVGGSVMTDIEVPDFDRHSLALSGIVLSTTSAGRIRPVGARDRLDDVLGSPALASREFPMDGDLRMYGEIYARPGVSGVSASVAVKGGDGTVIYEAPFEPVSTPPGYMVVIPLRRLGPGSYVATIEATSAIPMPLSSSRTVAFRVK